MSQVHVIRHKVLLEGHSIRSVATEMKVSRNTVTRVLFIDDEDRSDVIGYLKPRGTFNEATGVFRIHPLPNELAPHFFVGLHLRSRCATRKHRCTDVTQGDNRNENRPSFHANNSR